MNEPVSVYNFTVEPDHTHFVGKNHLWVHNANKDCRNSNSKASDFEKYISNLPPGERVAAVKQRTAEVAAGLGWSKDRRLTKLNNRDVYKGSDGFLYSVDTQHGRFEKINARNGKHLGEVDIDLNPVTGKLDRSGNHDLRV